ncbi:hypothetical protein GF357_04950 [Candidatus Dojkabacteria bacterium]|nr:hypothetical protein [Candidatus Dojkabacteria bacterium]
MLDKIFISKVRVKLLQLYTKKPDLSLHVRGLVRELDEEINAVRRELNNLEDAGILQSEKKGNKLMYSIDEGCPIIPELKAMFRKDDPVIRRISKALGEIDKISIAMLTDSYLKNKYEDHMDIDMLIVGQPDVDKVSSKIAELEKDISKTLKVSIVKDDEFDFRKKKNDPFINKILKNDKILLVGETHDLF